MSLTVIGAIERGSYVARVPSRGMVVRVPLQPIGTRIGGVEIGAICARLGTTEVGGKFWRKLKRKARNAVKKTVNIAKKIASNKIVKGLYNAAKQLAPSPINQVLGAVETGVKFGKALAQGSRAARAALPIVKKLAAGKISLSEAQRLAPKAGVKPSTVRDAAATIKLKSKARSNPKVAQLFKNVAEIEAAAKVAEPAPSHRRFITARSGRKYAVTIQRAA